MPDGEPRTLLAGVGEAGQTQPLFSWHPDNRHLIVTRSDGPTPGRHLWVADTRTSRLTPLTVTPGNESGPSVLAGWAHHRVHIRIDGFRPRRDPDRRIAAAALS